MTRRQFVFGAAATGTTGAAYHFSPHLVAPFGEALGICGDLPSPVVDSKELDALPHANVPDLYPAIYGHKQFTLSGETSHADPRQSFYFYSEDNIRMMAESGIRHLCIEEGYTHQKEIYQLYRGEMSAEDYAEKNLMDWGYGDLAYENSLFVANGIHHLSEYGIKVHCIDTIPDERDQIDDGFLQYVSDTIKFNAKACGQEAGIGTKTYITFLLLSLHRAIYYASAKIELINIRKNDVKKVEFIKELCGNEKTVIRYGDMHFENHDTSFKNLLGKENTIHIQIYGERSKMRFLKERDGNENVNPSPDFLHFIKEMEIIAAPSCRYSELIQSAPGKDVQPVPAPRL